MRVTRKPTRELDNIDLNILDVLQQDGRISFTDLAVEVGLSTTPCLERVRRLEEAGIINGYRAEVNPGALGLNLLVFLEVSLRYQSSQAFDDFRQAARQIPNLLECHLISGEADYVLKLRLTDISEYRHTLGDILALLPGVQESRSYIVMEEVKAGAAYPTAHLRPN
ncbi:MAG: Lrp/AsnC ligand binding domain-containing protein [Natronospirillum sp.]|uniref:Lrp/AsnC ligand binding domain-containing protein n=1 Tax=Natronospirillum sp. TaxID=2812955 RepID=UPI0025EAEDE5|nr:Lrp/AsnC ligand binding domain-containing protein [Natronospirillum sp.]MCH8552095.1 Lrp/AsnC ligand binding domain-containing protein [Natronospirillum sp.]